MKKLSIQNRIDWMFYGLAVWDALWIPTETMTKQEIIKKFWARADLLKNLKCYLPCLEDHKFIPNYPAWKWTDDTQLSLATARSLIDKQGIDLQDMWFKYVEEYDKDTSWWWWSTRAAVLRLKKWSSYKESWEKEWAWNWVIMRISPLSIFLAQSAIQKIEQDIIIEEFTRTTHDADIAVINSIIQNDLLWILWNECSKSEFYDEKNRIEILTRLKMRAFELENKFNVTFLMSERINLLIQKFNELPDDETLIDISSWWWSFAPFSQTMSLWLFFSDPSFNCIWRAAIIWWDTDSNASIVWSLTWVINWVECGINNLIKDLYKKDMIWEISKAFSDLIT